MEVDMPVMYLIVRKDLEMSPGKLAGQVGHGVQYAMTSAEVNHNPLLTEWKSNGHSTKILLGIKSLDKMLELQSQLPIPSSLVVDRGLTELPPDTVTVLAFEPAYKSQIFPYLKRLQKF